MHVLFLCRMSVPCDEGQVASFVRRCRLERDNLRFLEMTVGVSDHMTTGEQRLTVCANSLSWTEIPPRRAFMEGVCCVQTVVEPPCTPTT